MLHTTPGIALWQWRTQALQRIRQQPQEIQVNLQAELDILIQHFSELDRLALRLETYKTQPQINLTQPLEYLEQLWQRRLNEQVPLQYLLEKAYWRGLRLKVSPAVLIPRPETEEIIELAIAASQNFSNLTQPQHWADLGSGSGAIAIGLALAMPEIMVHAVDTSSAALEVATENVQTQGLANRIKLYQGSWLGPLFHLRGQLSGIVSNPPYIPTALIAQLQPEVRQHEPQLALDGGEDGLDAIRQIIATAPDYLHSGGVLLMELMQGQSKQVEALLAEQGSYIQIQSYVDLSGTQRFVLSCRV
jgi:release factor glutamine methyltransferase